MIFPHSFYEDEIRSDYIVPSMIKRSWAAQMEILDDLDRACTGAGMEYFAEWGTLLGTVRHGGFIPWDDDMDICMKRRDYMYLIDNVSTLLPDNYSIVSYRSSRDFKQMLCRIVSSDHYRFDGDYMKKYSGLPFALGIDIFPLDFLTDDEGYEKEREERVRLVYEAVNEMAVYDTPAEALSERLKLIEKRCRTNIDREGDVLTQLRVLLEKLFGEVPEKDAKYITLYPLWMNSHTFRFPVSYYATGVRLPFENMTIPVPACYDAVLSRKYGSSYMTPVRSGGAHDYPYCEEHINVLKEHFGYEWPSYKFDPKDLPDAGRKNKTTDHGRAVFITYGAKAFENMRPLVREYTGKGYDVTILPVAKYDISPDMTAVTASDERMPDDFYRQGNENITVTDDAGVLADGPSVIVTNYPYDMYNLITTVDKAYYSHSLRQHTKRLVYVPPFEMKTIADDDMRSRKIMPLYACTPMAAVCDEIVLHSEKMKAAYVDCLSGLSGEGYRSMWEDKIRVLERKDPEEEPASSCRKRVLFYVGIAGFAQYGTRMTDKIERVFEMFDKNSGSVEVVFRPQKGLSDSLGKMYPDLYELYRKYEARACSKDEDANVFDAYYGEPSEYASKMFDEHRPVMIIDPQV